MSLEGGDKNNEVSENQEVERQQEIQQKEAEKNAETNRRGSELDDRQDLDAAEKTEGNTNLENKTKEPERKEDPENKTVDPEKHNMSELPENAEIVDASKIDMTYAKGMEDEHFWDHHENTKEDYMRIAEHIPDVQKELDSGKTLDEIREDPELSDTVNAYYDADKMVKVEEKPDGSYEFQDDGRHRVAAAQELGYEIPVDVVNKGEYQKETRDAAEADEAENTEGRTLDQIMDGKSPVKSMDSIEKSYESLQKRFDDSLYDAPDKTSQAQGMEKLYGENAQAVHDVYDKKQEVDQRKDEIMEKIRDMHMKDEDVTPENNPELKALSEEYHKCEDDSRRLDYLQAKLEDNNLQITEATGRDYIATSDEFMANRGGPEAEAAYYEKYLDSSLDKLDNQETSAVDAYAFAQVKERLSDSIDRLETAYAPDKPDGPAVPKEKIDELRNKMDELGSKYAEEYKDCKFQTDGTYDRTETKKTEEKELFSSEIKTDQGEKSFSVRKGARESRLDENRTIFSDRLNKMEHKETSDGLKIETSSSKIDEQGNVSKKEFSASALNTDIERSYDRTKGEVRGKVETNIAKAESSRTDQTETGVKETHKSAVIGHTEVTGEVKADDGKLKTAAGYESRVAEAKYERTSMNKTEDGSLEKDSEIKVDASIGRTSGRIEVDTEEKKIKAEASSTVAEAGGSYSGNVLGKEVKAEARGSIGEKRAEAAVDLKKVDIHAKAESSTAEGSVKVEAGSWEILNKSGKIDGQKVEADSEVLSKISDVKQNLDDTKKKLGKLHDLLKKKTE